MLDNANMGVVDLRRVAQVVTATCCYGMKVTHVASRFSKDSVDCGAHYGVNRVTVLAMAAFGQNLFASGLLVVPWGSACIFYA